MHSNKAPEEAPLWGLIAIYLGIYGAQHPAVQLDLSHLAADTPAKLSICAVSNKGDTMTAAMAGPDPYQRPAGHITSGQVPGLPDDKPPRLRLEGTRDSSSTPAPQPTLFRYCCHVFQSSAAHAIFFGPASGVCSKS